MSEEQTRTTWPVGGPRGRQRGRCTKCSEPAAARGLCSFHYAKMRTHLHAVGAFESRQVPIEPARERVAALRAAGVGLPRLEQLTGIHLMTLWRLTHDPDRTQTTREVERAVLEIDVPTQRVDPLLAPGAFVDVVPSQRRIRALAVIGYRQDDLLERMGIKTGTCALNKVYAASLPKVTARRHRVIAALFDELIWTPGKSTRATRDATRKGWFGPWAWDDIEDPNCIPDAVPARERRRRKAARHARDEYLADVLADHIAVGRVRADDDEAVAAVLGITAKAVEHRRRRAARDDQSVAS